MKRRNFLQSMMGLALILLFPFAAKGTALVQKLNKSKTEWRALLPRERYEILFEEATERAGSSALNREKRAGTFICAACSLPLFSSAQKYDSGTGWPSFWQSLPNAVASRTDYKLIYPRTE